jgi:uncharacterized protein
MTDDLLAYLVRSLVDQPSDVSVESFDEEDGTTVLEIRVADDELGKVIGRRGRTVNALRVVMRACATKRGGRVLVDVVD